MSNINFEILEAKQLTRYQSPLEEIEASINYPIDNGNDYFTINHGDNYAAFFANMGTARFLITKSKNQVIGIMAGVWKNTLYNNKEVTGLYLADKKLKPEFRGQNITVRMMNHIFWAYLKSSRYKSWQFIYFAAMVGKKGDVTNSFGKLHLGNLSGLLSKLTIYFISAADLLQVQSDYKETTSARNVLNLSPNSPSICNNKGSKDLIIHSQQQHWDLTHINFNYAQAFREQCHALGKKIQQISPNTTVCFAIDQKRTELIKWLAENNIQSETTCNLYTFSWPIIGQKIAKNTFIHISTSEI